mmetsp:Transcript_11486/g.14765  ORF Transcript_11486/g.14765 Transcript_11486/m.14765 type:complete len:286 (+) Transcript_11486:106-963(+)
MLKRVLLVKRVLPLIRAMSSLLPISPSSHNSVTIDIGCPTFDHHNLHSSQFSSLLTKSVNNFKEEGKSACWLKLPLKYAHYIPVASDIGFKYHHAEGNQATMSLWLKTDIESRIPRYATHQVGVGGMVLRGKQKNGLPEKILVIKEVHKVNNNYKFPGGLADSGEHFGDVAIREVKEETGIDAEFNSILTIRQTHEVQFGVSDIYVIALLNPITYNIQKCNYEIEEAIWMDFNEFVKTVQHPMLKAAIDIVCGHGTSLTEEEHPNMIPNKPPYKLYHASTKKKKT